MALAGSNMNLVSNLKRVVVQVGIVVAMTAVLPVEIVAQEIDPNPVRGRFFVSDIYGNDTWSGMLPEPNAGRSDGPFKTLARAQQAHRTANLRTTIYVRQGTYYLPEPMVFEPVDSGSSWEVYPNEKVIVSGGLPIKEWQEGRASSVWSASVPEIRSKRLIFRQLRVGDELMTPARHPNADPVDPVKGGWSYVVPDESGEGAFGQAVSQIQNRGDWIEWRFNTTGEGTYSVYFLYAAQNRRFGFADLAGRMSVSVDSGTSVPLQNLPDSTSYRWSKVADVQIGQPGGHSLRWLNDQGGYINLDAILVTNDPNYRPGGRVAAGRDAAIIQAETMVASESKTMVAPETKSTYARDRFTYKYGDMKAYTRSPDAEVHIFPAGGEANTILYPGRIDTRSRTVLFRPGPNAGLELRGGNRYFVANAIEVLDSNGEWYADERAATIYLQPKAADFQRQGVVAAANDRIFHLKGDASRNEWVQELSFKGFTFMDTSWSAQFSPFTPNDAAIWLDGARQCVFERCRFLNLGGYAFRLENKSERNEIVGNEIGPVGQGGVVMVGPAASQAVNNLIAGNWMHDLGRVLKHVAGVYCISGSNNKIANNLFENLPRYAVSLKSLDEETYSHGNVVENNEIRNACLETSKGAAIEVYGRHRLDTGNVIQNNRILDVVGCGTDEAGRFNVPDDSFGILLDAFASGVTVKNNVVARNHQGGIAIRGGSRNAVENNVFALGTVNQVHFDSVDTQAVDNRFVRNIIYHQSPVSGFITTNGRLNPKFLQICDYNLYWHKQGVPFFSRQNIQMTPAGTFANWQKGGFGAHSVISDPGFSSLASDNFSVSLGSSAVSKLEFEPIPTDRIGLEGYDRSWKKN